MGLLICDTSQNYYFCHYSLKYHDILVSKYVDSSDFLYVCSTAQHQQALHMQATASGEFSQVHPIPCSQLGREKNRCNIPAIRSMVGSCYIF